MKKIRVKVTKRDIKLGLREDMTRCPVALALHHRKFKAANVCYNLISLDGLWYRPESIPSPKSVERFVKRFDAGKPVRPFSFTLKIPAPPTPATAH